MKWDGLNNLRKDREYRDARAVRVGIGRRSTVLRLRGRCGSIPRGGAWAVS